MHDRNGTELKVGDTVIVLAKIKALQATPDFCNVDVETIHGRRPDDLKSTISAINTAQLLLVDRDA